MVNTGYYRQPQSLPKLPQNPALSQTPQNPLARNGMTSGTWTAPQLVNGMFPDQGSIDSYKTALNFAYPRTQGSGQQPGTIDYKSADPIAAKNYQDAYKFGVANGWIDPNADDNMFSLENITPLLMAALPFMGAMGLGPLAGSSSAAAGAADGGWTGGGAGSSEAMGGFTGTTSSAAPVASAGGLGGATTVGEMFGAPAVTGGGLAGGVGATGVGASSAGGLATGVGAGAGYAGTGLGSGMTTGSAAGAAAGGSKLSGFLDTFFGPGAKETAAKIGLIAPVGQAALDLYQSGKREDVANTSAGLADPFASQRGQYQTQLSNLMKDPSLINNDPSYQFRLKSGQDALERSNAAKGYLGSGNMLIDLQQYGQRAASDEYNNQIKRLSELAGAQFGPGTAGTNYQTGMNGSLAQQYQGLSALGTAGRELWNNRDKLANLFG